MEPEFYDDFEDFPIPRNGSYREPFLGTKGVDRIFAADMDEIHRMVPGLSAALSCSPEDAFLLRSALMQAQRVIDRQAPSSFHRPSSISLPDIESLNATIARLESDNVSLRARLEKKAEEIDKLKEQVAEARGREEATVAAHRNSIRALSLRAEGMKKQLLQEESRNSKLEHRERTLSLEVERLKIQCHKALMK